MRDFEITSNEGAKKSGWKIIVPFPGELVGKAVLEDKDNGITIMKSTKRFEVNEAGNRLGWIYNTSTEYHKGENVSIAEALVFVSEK